MIVYTTAYCDIKEHASSTRFFPFNRPHAHSNRCPISQRAVPMWASGSQPTYGILRPIAATPGLGHEHRRTAILGLFGGVPESRLQTFEVNETDLSIRQARDVDEPLAMFPNAMHPPRSIQGMTLGHLQDREDQAPCVCLVVIEKQPKGVISSYPSAEHGLWPA